MPNFVASTTSSRRPAIARPTSSSLVNGPYMSAVSRRVTPRSSARWIVRDRLGVVAGAVELAHAHAAEAEGGDGGAAGRRAVASASGDCRPRATVEAAAPVPALSLRALTKRYDNGFLALDAFDVEIPDGAFFGLLGPNGAGKTTLISAVCNLIRASGRSRSSASTTRGAGPHADRLAEQDVNLDRFLDVEETLLYHGGYYGMDRARAGAGRGR